MDMDSENEYRASEKYLYVMNIVKKTKNKDRTFIINKQAPACFTTQHER